MGVAHQRAMMKTFDCSPTAGRRPAQRQPIWRATGPCARVVAAPGRKYVSRLTRSEARGGSAIVEWQMLYCGSTRFARRRDSVTGSSFSAMAPSRSGLVALVGALFDDTYRLEGKPAGPLS